MVFSELSKDSALISDPASTLPNEPIELKSIFGDPLSVPPKVMPNIVGSFESVDTHPSSLKGVYGDEFITEIPFVDKSIHAGAQLVQAGSRRRGSTWVSRG